LQYSGACSTILEEISLQVLQGHNGVVFGENYNGRKLYLLNYYFGNLYFRTNGIESNESVTGHDDIWRLGVLNWRVWQVVKENGNFLKKNYAHLVGIQPRYNLLYRMIEEDLATIWAWYYQLQRTCVRFVAGLYRTNTSVEEGTHLDCGYVI
jgi:hypothetical protein